MFSVRENNKLVLELPTRYRLNGSKIWIRDYSLFTDLMIMYVDVPILMLTNSEWYRVETGVSGAFCYVLDHPRLERLDHIRKHLDRSHDLVIVMTAATNIDVRWVEITLRNDGPA